MLAQTVQLDQEALTEVEERSESLANALLDLSVAVRQTDFRVLQEFFSPQVQAKRFPNFPSAGAPSSKWISRRHLEFAATQALSMERDDFLQQWRGFLAGFSQIEDARFKVQDARFSEEPTGTLGEGKIKFFLVGRDRTDKRCWIRGTGSIEARQGDGGTWQISEWILDQMRWSLADVDLFPEVSLPAGVSVSLPRYGSPGNDDFVYHGAAAGDLNADGLIDIVATGILHNYVYLNRGDGTFKEVSSGVGLPPTPQASGCLLLDFDNDKDLDLFFSAVGHQMLFENRWVPDGKLLFSDVSLEAGVALPAVGFSATAGDVNSDGWPDLYVASYNRYGRIMPNSWHQATNGTLNLLFVNQKDGTFKESAKSWGVQDRRWSYAAQFADLNNDHRLDLYVANDFGENALFMNLGDRFEDRAAEWGVLDPGNGMGVSFGDYNNDGVLDLYVTNMSSTAGNRILRRLFPESDPQGNVLPKLAAGNTLFKGGSGASFRDVSQEVGPFGGGWAWGGVFVDFDNDGWEDLYCPNGFLSGKSMKDT